MRSRHVVPPEKTLRGEAQRRLIKLNAIGLCRSCRNLAGSQSFYFMRLPARPHATGQHRCADLFLHSQGASHEKMDSSLRQRSRVGRVQFDASDQQRFGYHDELGLFRRRDRGRGARRCIDFAQRLRRADDVQHLPFAADGHRARLEGNSWNARHGRTGGAAQRRFERRG